MSLILPVFSEARCKDILSLEDPPPSSRPGLEPGDRLIEARRTNH